MIKAKKITKEEIDKLVKQKGKIRGVFFKGFYNYIFEKKGQEGIKIIEKGLAEFGYNLNLKKTSSFAWYPEGLIGIIFFLIFKHFDWKESEAFNIGYQSLLSSFSTKNVLFKLFNVETGLKMVEKYWPKYSTVGKFYYSSYNIKEKWAILRVEGVNWPYETSCNYIMGVLLPAILN